MTRSRATRSPTICSARISCTSTTATPITTTIISSSTPTGRSKKTRSGSQDHVTLVTRRHRHRLGRHAGHLLPHQPAPLRRGPHQPLLRGLARDAVPVAGRADALSERRAHRRRRARRHHRRGLRGGGRRARRHRHRRGHPHRRGAAARERPGDRRTAGRAARRFRHRHRRPPHGGDAGGLRLGRREACPTTRTSASSTSTSAAAPPSSASSRKATWSRPPRSISAAGCRWSTRSAASSGSIRPAATTRARPAFTGTAATCSRRPQLDKVAEAHGRRAGRARSASVRCRTPSRISISPIRSPSSAASTASCSPAASANTSTAARTRDFGDMGRRLGRAIRRRVDAGALPWPLLPAGECIRATALGASEYSVQLSGNTSYISKPGRAAAAAQSAGAAAALRLRGGRSMPARSPRRSARISPPSI